MRTYVSVVFWAMTPAAAVHGGRPGRLQHPHRHPPADHPHHRHQAGRDASRSSWAASSASPALMTLVLRRDDGVSLLYVLRGVDPEAAAESLKARVPVYGELHFENTAKRDKGDNVGREWDYRSYITAPVSRPEPPIAVWAFPACPAEPRRPRQAVRCEFTFDIYRTTKGEENKGVSCTFAFQTWRLRPRQRGRVPARARGRALQSQGDPSDARHRQRSWPRSSATIEIPGQGRVTDYHTQCIDVPGGLFRNARERTRRCEPAARSKPEPRRLQVRVTLRQPHAVRRHGQVRPVPAPGRPRQRRRSTALLRRQLLQGGVRPVAAPGAWSSAWPSA